VLRERGEKAQASAMSSSTLVEKAKSLLPGRSETGPEKPVKAGMGSVLSLESGLSAAAPSLVSLKDDSSAGAASAAGAGHFLPSHPALSALVIAFLLTVPLYTVLVFTFIFQILFFSTAFVVYLVVMIALLFRVRARPLHSKQQRWLLWLYVLLCTTLMLTGLFFVLRPALVHHLRVETAVLGGLSSRSINISVFADDAESYFVLARPLSSSSSSGSVGAAGGDTDALDLSSWSAASAASHINLPVQLSGLEPDVKYEYQVVFRSALPAERAGPTGRFRTLPDPDSSSPMRKVTFASSSCSMKNRMLGGVELEAYSRISASAPDLDFMLFLGDFVYVDVPWGIGYSGIGYGANRELYDVEYRGTLDDKHVNAFLRNTPTFWMFDDHEINNDWAGGNDEARYNASISSWERYLGAVNPPAVAEKAAYYSFDAGAAHVFMTDSRSLRDQEKGVVIGAAQLAALQQWLLEQQRSHPKEWKIIASTPGVSRNEPDPTASWNCRCPRCEPLSDANRAQCPDELDQGILQFVEDNNITGVMFVSGDTHKPGVYELRPGVIEFSASPIHGIGTGVFPQGQDKVLFDETSLLEVWSIIEIEGGKLSVKIYGGGYHPLGLLSAWVVGTALAMYVGAVLVLRGAPEEDKIPHILRDRLVAAVLTALLLTIICICLFNVLPVFVDKDFEAPVYQFEHELL
jgi:hypothetical protein